MRKIFHKLGLRNQIDISYDMFKHHTPKISLIEQTNFIINNLTGPETGTSVSYNKTISLRKASSEALERRSAMLGSVLTDNSNEFVETWDLISNKRSYIKQKYTRLLQGKIDTTGTATHYDSHLSIYNAVKELLEKNALFLFWYGIKGFKVIINKYSTNPYYLFFTKSGYQTSVFVNDFFQPLKTVIVIVWKEDDQFISGLGTDVLFEEALFHAFEEAFLIGYMQYYGFLFNIERAESSYCNNKKVAHLEKLKKLNYYSYYDYEENKKEINSLVSSLPEFIEELHVVFITQYLNPNLKCVKVYSKDLINCLPMKSSIDLTLSINKNTVMISNEELNRLPECPMS